MTDKAIENYSLRQLSPFRGTVQVVNSPFARAVTVDGQQWQIQVSCEVKQQQWGILNSPQVQRRYVLYGTWTEQRDLASLPLDPMLDVPDDQLLETSLLIHLRQLARQIPFAPMDHFELWLMHQQSGQPLALIASASHEHALEQIKAARWRASSSRQQSFRPLRAHCSTDAILKIEHLISQQCSSPLTAQWFHRQLDGSGRGINSSDLPAEDFPELLIREDWPEENDRLLAEDYHHWLSPQLLLLPRLSHASRLRLEQAAQQHALEVSRLHHLYPAIADQKIMNRILVEARLRKSSMT
ncbi:MAG: hypothetical protein EP315_06775 [Gammaproteobacteria bacterium]|nr:MAG: hypothetical protein EP315_06775 [Gammaproteobacteria bacterium]